MKQSEIRPLTSLRFIAALVVFLLHTLEVSGKASTLWEAVIVEAGSGVTVFFVLSGFLITLLYFDEEQTQHDEKPTKHRSLGEYLARRIARICPLYYFLLVLVFLWQISRGEQNSKDVLIHLTMTQGYFLKFWSHDILTAWSLSVEMSFYLLAPLTFWLFNQFNRSRGTHSKSQLGLLTAYLAALVVLFGALGLGLQRLSIATGIVYSAGFMGGLEIAGTSKITYTTIFFRIFEFAVGIWCAYFYTAYLKNKWWKQPSTAWIATALVVLSFCAILFLQYGLNLQGGFYDRKGHLYNYLIAGTAGLLIVALTRPNTLPYRILSLPLPVYLGRIAYALYLIQKITFLTVALTGLAYWLGIPVPQSKPIPAGWVIYLYITMSLISALLYETVEKYGGRLIMTMYWRLQKRTSLRSAKP